jgi:DNA-binding NarL/FixJ family response regulator
MGIFNFKKHTNRPKKTTIYIVEDNVLYTRQLEFFLQNKFGDNVGVYSFPVSEVLEVKLEHGHIPDVIIMDNNLSEKYEDAASGLESLRAIHTQYPDIQLILHTAQGDGGAMGSALAEGVCMYVPKGGEAFSMLGAIIGQRIENKA